MTDTSTTTTNFYNMDAREIYAADFDYTVIESAQPLPSLRDALRSALACTLVVAAVAGILTIPAGGNLPFAVSEPAVASEDISHSPRSPDMVTMTAYMREQAALAARLFQRTPHPGDDDVEPDYGL